ncbi:unnamed protein product, partial [Laminaria digitata]
GFGARFIAKHLDALASPAPVTPKRIASLAALAELTRTAPTTDTSPWASSGGWRLGGAGAKRITLMEGAERVGYVLQDGRLIRDAEPVSLSGGWKDETRFNAVIDGAPVSAIIVRHDQDIVVFADQGRFVVSVDNPLVARQGSATDAGTLVAHMPGVVVAVHVENGEAVSVGTPLLAVEAMKVEHTIRAPTDGIVTALHFAVGDRVAEGVELVSFAPAGTD